MTIVNGVERRSVVFAASKEGAVELTDLAASDNGLQFGFGSPEATGSDTSAEVV
jgi:hypothetical protein